MANFNRDYTIDQLRRLYNGLLLMNSVIQGYSTISGSRPKMIQARKLGSHMQKLEQYDNAFLENLLDKAFKLRTDGIELVEQARDKAQAQIEKEKNDDGSSDGSSGRQ